MRKDKMTGQVLRTVRKASRKGGIVDRLLSNLTARDKQRLQRSAKALDHDFMLEKAYLIKDLMTEIIPNRQETSNPLLQRSAWAAMDALALHLDATGFTKTFQALAPKMFRGIRFDDPAIVAMEYGLMSDVMGGEAELTRLGLLSFTEVEEVIRYAEKNRTGPDGFRGLARKNFSFKEDFANSCGRPDKMLEVVIHSPQATKLIVLLVLVVVNVIGLVIIVAFWETLIGILIGALIFVATVIIVKHSVGGC